MERLIEFVELKEEVRRVKTRGFRCQKLFFHADDVVSRYARLKNPADLNRLVEIKRDCLHIVVNAENVCRRVGNFFVELSAFDDVKLYAETFELLTIAQETVRDCLQWYRDLCELADEYVFAD